MIQSEQKRAFLAIILSGVILFAWQSYFSKQQQQQQQQQPQQVSSTTPVQSSQPTSAVLTTVSSPTNTVSAIQNVELASEKLNVNFSSDLSFNTFKSSTAALPFLDIVGSANPLTIQVLIDGKAETILLQTISKTEKTFEAKNEQFGINFKSTLSDDGKVNLAVNSAKPYRYRFTFNSTEKKLDNGQVRNFSMYAKDLTTIAVGSKKEKEFPLRWVGVDFDFHLFSLVFKNSNIFSTIKTTEDGKMIVDITDPTTNLNTDLVYTKKVYDQLLGMGDMLHYSVDFGYFSILAVPMLRALQFIYKYIPNYGIAIVLVTILIRLITFPLQFKSFKSMKKMQKIQPQINAIKEKFKDEPQKLQQETMELFKKEGANPLSGCLPLLLQMPFFLAIYRVLFSSVELVGSPFFGWIHDLSVKDPFYVLPVLMGLSMFIQQKVTPQTSVDPTQQKVMLLMPVIFAFMMKGLPSGLVLYIFVSTLFGLIQQLVVYKTID